MATAIRKSSEVREILQDACARREMLILVTPYLRFESSFAGLEGSELHALATMSRDDAVFGLKAPGLKIRFPHGLGFYEADVEMKGLGLLGQRRTLRLSIPSTLVENDQRVAYRVERVGRIGVTFSTPKPDLYQASLSDISVTGARLHASEDIPRQSLDVGQEIALTIPVQEGIIINGHALVRHLKGRSFGVEFRPPLPKTLLEPLSRWVFQRREEERERMARRLELGLQTGRPSGLSLPPRGIILVAAGEGLEHQLRIALPTTHPLARVAPTAQNLKEALQSRPALVILHLPGTSLDDRRRTKALAEIAAGRAPVLLLGSDMDGAVLFELASEWKASSALVWGPHRAPFFQRLVQGIIRRHHEGGESPLAPSEAEL
ncbi:MAG: PilZ domain-containing protein [Acidobacteria bacterium]|nr:PilZ domain-containing protein [Acidobacteriota bacterium]